MAQDGGTDGGSGLELVYKESCKYCLMIARWLGRLDWAGKVRLTPIESERGRSLVEDHHGRFVDSPHFFTPDVVYYGVRPTAEGVVKELPKAYLPVVGR